MSRVRNRVFTEGCSAGAQAQIAQKGTTECRDRRVDSQIAQVRERKPAGERDEVIWSAVLGYN